MTEQFTFSKEFTEENSIVRSHWEIGRTAAKNVANHLNKLVEIVHREEPDWKINKIAQQIWIANEDLEGFSKDTVYRNLNDEHKALVRKYDQKQEEQQQNNVLEETFLTRENENTEQSSSRTLPTAYEVKNAETVQEEEQLRDLPEPTSEEITEMEQGSDTIFDKAFVDRLIKENAELTEKFSFDYDFELKDQIIPLKITVYPSEKYGHVRLRKEGKAK